ncbi:hypothetical protein Tco_0970125 [Tanacetum coccineum]
MMKAERMELSPPRSLEKGEIPRWPNKERELMHTDIENDDSEDSVKEYSETISIIPAEYAKPWLEKKLQGGKTDENCAYKMLKMMEKQAGVNTPGSDENRLKLYDLMYIFVMLAEDDGLLKTFEE